MVLKVYDTHWQARPNLFIWYILGMHDGETEPTLILFSDQNWLQLNVKSELAELHISHTNSQSAMTS
jgi:hypothetical protein